MKLCELWTVRNKHSASTLTKYLYDDSKKVNGFNSLHTLLKFIWLLQLIKPWTETSKPQGNLPIKLEYTKLINRSETANLAFMESILNLTLTFKIKRYAKVVPLSID